MLIVPSLTEQFSCRENTTGYPVQTVIPKSGNEGGYTQQNKEGCLRKRDTGQGKQVIDSHTDQYGDGVGHQGEHSGLLGTEFEEEGNADTPEGNGDHKAKESGGRQCQQVGGIREGETVKNEFSEDSKEYACHDPGKGEKCQNDKFAEDIPFSGYGGDHGIFYPLGLFVKAEGRNDHHTAKKTACHHITRESAFRKKQDGKEHQDKEHGFCIMADII